VNSHRGNRGPEFCHIARRTPSLARLGQRPAVCGLHRGYTQELSIGIWLDQRPDAMSRALM
jgi:hypothetical protein